MTVVTVYLGGFHMRVSKSHMENLLSRLSPPSPEPLSSTPAGWAISPADQRLRAITRGWAGGSPSSAGPPGDPGPSDTPKRSSELPCHDFEATQDRCLPPITTPAHPPGMARRPYRRTYTPAPLPEGGPAVRRRARWTRLLQAAEAAISTGNHRAMARALTAIQRAHSELPRGHRPSRRDPSWRSRFKDAAKALVEAQQRCAHQVQ